MEEDRNIRYSGREFPDFKEQLVEMAKNYFPNTYTDFSEDSPGMMFIEMAAYVGDVLSFYQDIQLQETFLQHARNPVNLYTLAYMMGYTPKISSPSRVVLRISQEVDARLNEGVYEPNWDQALHIARGMKVSSFSGTGTIFTTEDIVDFSHNTPYSPVEVSIQELDGGNPLTYLLTKTVTALSGETKTIQRTIGVAEKYTSIEIEDQNIIGIEKITDLEGNEWREVPFLGQETVYEDNVNTGSDRNLVPYLLSLKKEPRRFTSRFLSPTQLQVQFGGGITGKEDTVFLPNPGMLSANTTLETAYDPSNFLFSNTYGLAPSNTTLTIQYRVGKGIIDNIPSNTLTEIVTSTITGVDLSKQGTLSLFNPDPGYGGRDGDTVEEIRENSLRSFAEQKRTVTGQDYEIRALSLPAKYGSISKVYARREENGDTGSLLERNPLAIQLFVLGVDQEGKMTTTSESLKNNLKKYLSQYISLTDAVDILDAYVVNLGVSYEVTVMADFAPGEVLLKCNQVLKQFFDTKNMRINTPINLSQALKALSQVRGVQTVTKIEVNNKSGGLYSPYGYDVKAATRNNIVYPSYDPCIFEVRFPNIDITGRTVTV